MSRVLFAILVAWASSLPCGAKDIVVDPKGGGDHSDIQSAIDAAEAGDTVLARAGEYAITETLSFRGKAIRVAAEAGPGETTIRMVEPAPDPTLASVVAFSGGEGPSSVLEGFTVTGGRGTGEDPAQLMGGGILCTDGSSPTIAGCAIEGNSAASGGGLYVASECSVSVLECVFRNNSSESGGGIISDGRVTVARSIFTGNSAVNLGGAAAVFDDATFEDSLFCGNTSRDGGGVCAMWETVSLDRCTFHGNKARSLGGAVLSAVESKVSIRSCIFWGNEAPEGSSLAVGDDHYGGSTMVSFSLVEGGLAGIHVRIGEPPEWVAGNLEADPLFVSPGRWDDGGTPDDSTDDSWLDGDDHLRPDSPAIDAGDPETEPSEDLDGRYRPCGEAVDLGAYETGECASPAKRFLRGDADSSGSLEISDPVKVLLHLFAGGTLGCLDAGDTDSSGALNLTDAIYGLSYLFLGGPAPPEPFPGCGTDPGGESLGCEAAPACP
jgi:hypothetical protein